MSNDLAEELLARANANFSRPTISMGKDAKESEEETQMMVQLLKSTILNSERLLDIISDDSELPEWCHSKIVMAEDYIETVFNYIESENTEFEK